MLYQADPAIDEAIEEICDLVDHVALSLADKVPRIHISIGFYEFFTRRVAARLLELPPDLETRIITIDTSDE